mmetsp:Transcript_17997/g.52606  ORF Transcript_17997/g.52606 Transcript_17997/m.52606 type:complete len:110 (-) Transcript_17997:234-563(-)
MNRPDDDACDCEPVSVSCPAPAGCWLSHVTLLFLLEEQGCNVPAASSRGARRRSFVESPVDVDGGLLLMWIPPTRRHLCLRSREESGRSLSGLWSWRPSLSPTPMETPT